MTSINFYKITSTNTDKVYVGSTKHDINERLKQHEANYRKFKDGKYHNVTSFEILECKDYKIELIENKFCESKEQRNTVECNYIINTPNTVNRNLPGRTREQYYQDNKEELLNHQRQYYQDNKQELNERHRQYYNDNKEQIDEYQRQYRQENKDYFQQYRQENKEDIEEYQRQYYQDNKEQIGEQQRQYRQDNKEERNRKANEKHTCQCGGKFTNSGKSRHDKSQKHQTFIRIHQPINNYGVINIYNAPNQ
jgi:hypothetical protein